jgi:predicted esterase
MRNSLLVICIILLFGRSAFPQDIIKPAPVGFDTLRIVIAHGKLDSISYSSKTVGTMLAKFDELGIKYQYIEYPGGHTWPVWRNNL